MILKKAFFPIILSLLLLSTACSAADVDLRKKDLVYDGFADAINHPESYVDKTVDHSGHDFGVVCHFVPHGRA